MNVPPTLDPRRRIEELQQELTDRRKMLRELRRTAAPEPVAREYRFAGPGGATASLGDLFGQRRELIVLHNMGKSCNYCTLWADGFNGILAHLENRASVVLISPDPPDVQQEFAASRGWRFRMWSADPSFLTDMKMADEKRAAWPGLSAFVRREDGVIARTGYDYFGPGDDYCPIWHVMDLFPEGAGGWEPKTSYGA